MEYTHAHTDIFIHIIYTCRHGHSALTRVTYYGYVSSVHRFCTYSQCIGTGEIIIILAQEQVCVCVWLPASACGVVWKEARKQTTNIAAIIINSFNQFTLLPSLASTAASLLFALLVLCIVWVVVVAVDFNVCLCRKKFSSLSLSLLCKFSSWLVSFYHLHFL